MVSTAMSADVTTRDDDRTVIWLDGEHDIATLPALADTLARAISADAAHLVIDLSGVEFIGAATIDELIRCRNSLCLQSRTLTVRSPSRFARRLLDLCGLTDIVEP
jgi:anti-sigma B factor antagonist